MVEDGLGMKLLQTPQHVVNETIKIENNTLQVRPLKLQPPSHITYSYLQNDIHRTRWMMNIPWRIEVGVWGGVNSRSRWWWMVRRGRWT